MPNHCTSIYHEWMCVCVAALKAIVTRYTAQSVMRTCMLPRELIWERVAPSHTGVTENSGLAFAAVIVLLSALENAWHSVDALYKFHEFKFSCKVLFTVSDCVYICDFSMMLVSLTVNSTVEINSVTINDVTNANAKSSLWMDPNAKYWNRIWTHFVVVLVVLMLNGERAITRQILILKICVQKVLILYEKLLRVWSVLHCQLFKHVCNALRFYLLFHLANLTLKARRFCG